MVQLKTIPEGCKPPILKFGIPKPKIMTQTIDPINLVESKIEKQEEKKRKRRKSRRDRNEKRRKLVDGTNGKSESSGLPSEDSLNVALVTSTSATPLLPTIDLSNGHTLPTSSKGISSNTSVSPSCPVPPGTPSIIKKTPSPDKPVKEQLTNVNKVSNPTTSSPLWTNRMISTQRAMNGSMLNPLISPITPTKTQINRITSLESPFAKIEPISPLISLQSLRKFSRSGGIGDMKEITGGGRRLKEMVDDNISSRLRSRNIARVRDVRPTMIFTPPPSSPIEEREGVELDISTEARMNKDDFQVSSL